jgi:hypothetical protein
VANVENQTPVFDMGAPVSDPTAYRRLAWALQ